MGRAKGNLIENLATLPWPAGVVFDVGEFFAIHSEAHAAQAFPIEDEA
jgi:hypothetical protein